MKKLGNTEEPQYLLFEAIGASYVLITSLAS